MIELGSGLSADGSRWVYCRLSFFCLANAA
jgi:hypothetical protein